MPGRSKFPRTRRDRCKDEDYKFVYAKEEEDDEASPDSGAARVSFGKQVKLILLLS